MIGRLCDTDHALSCAEELQKKFGCKWVVNWMGCKLDGSSIPHIGPEKQTFGLDKECTINVSVFLEV